MVDSRVLAASVLADIINQQPTSQLVIKKQFGDDSSFIHMLVQTALRHLVYIDQIINRLSSSKKQRALSVKTALILGITELLYMDTAEYAVINSYVDIVKKQTNKFVAGFVNAVLRNVCRQKNELQKNDCGVFFTKNFRDLLRNSYPDDIIDLIEKSSLQEPLLDITLKNTDSAVCNLGQTLPLGTLRLSNQGKIEKLPDYDRGVWWVQDFSSSLPVKMLDNLKNKNVLDVCAAPGGKTAQLLSSGAKVTALDISPTRLKTLQHNLNRLHLQANKIICDDALNYLNTTRDKYDVVVLDAPCSATGTLRRHPEIVHTKTSNDVIQQSLLQKRLLSAAKNVLHPEGLLLYCTCSLCHEEGERQIDEFISTNPQFSIINLADKLPEDLLSAITPQGYIRMLPHYLEKYGYADGFFIALLQSKS